MTSREPYCISVPGKTFLVGEYLALYGGPSLVLTTVPRFELRAARSVAAGVLFNRHSPAGRFLERNLDQFAGYGFEFDDPHHGRGGLGASSAQFALVYAALSRMTQVEPASFDWRALLDEYRVCAWNGEGVPPSGADLVAQMVGGVCWFDGVNSRARRLAWSFSGLGFSLIRTGNKLVTHEHLRESPAVSQTALREQVEAATFALESADEGVLVTAVRRTATILRESGLVAGETQSLLEELQSVPEVLAAKGCGAMGADIVLVLHEKRTADLLKAWTVARGFELCGSDRDLSSQGLMEMKQ